VLKPTGINLKYLIAILNSIDFNNPSEEAIYDKLVTLVDRMLELHKKKASIPPSAEREKIEREIIVDDYSNSIFKSFLSR